MFSIASRQHTKIRAAEAAHRQKVWDTLVEIWPGFAEYQIKTERRIPLVRLQRIS